MFKQTILTPTTLLVLLSVSAAARGTQSLEPQRLEIKNDTTYELVVAYSTPSYSLCEKVLLKGETLSISDPQTIKSLKIYPGGKVWTHSQVAKPENHANTIIEKAFNEPAYHVLLRVGPSDKASSKVGNIPVVGYVAKKAEEYLAPFGFHWSKKQKVSVRKEDAPKSFVPESRLIVDAFPHVKNALHTNKNEAQPRNFLELAQGASKEAIDHEYNALKAKWENEKKLYPYNTNYANRVLELLASAHRLLLCQEEFNYLVKQNCTLHLHIRRDDAQPN